MMVIPRVARQKGITVRLYAVFVVVFGSIGFTLLYSQRVSAAPPLISGIPIIGHPVASVVDVVADNVVKPVINTVTNVLFQQPVGASKSPTRSAAMPRTTDVASSETATQPPLVAEQTDQPVPNEPITKANPSVGSYTPLILSGYLPVTSDMNAKFSTPKDISVLAAAGVIALLMLFAFIRLIAMMIRNTNRSVSTNEATLVRRDLAQASALTFGLFVIGPFLLFIFLR